MDEDKLVDMFPAPCIPIFYLLCVLTFNNIFQTDIFVNKSMSKDSSGNLIKLICLFFVQLFWLLKSSCILFVF